jgi:type II restriction/modification system DNA methylase subunit YeeA
MDITAIRVEAPRARRQLMEGVERRCLLFGIEEGATPDVTTVGSRVLSTDERRQRDELLRIQVEIGHDALVERAAYTWFDRLLAIRFMEVNDRLPSHVRVLSARDGSFDPECLHEALDLPLPALDLAEVASLVAAGDDEALFRVIFLAQCEELAGCMPSVFDRVKSAMELLLPDGLLAEGGVVDGLVTSIPEPDWTQGVEIVGWAYQFYVSERKDEYFASKRKAGRSDIAPATQLFTPEWIVRYLAENSLGRLWMANHSESRLTDSMVYYIPTEGGQSADFRHIASPEEITVIDPACGSGHMLTCCFDLLANMYVESGYRRRDIPRLILQHNLTGIEIDPRAAALASFALTMKACEFDPRFLTRSEHISPHVVCLEAVGLTPEELDALPATLELNASLDTLRHLDEVGSLWQPTSGDAVALAAVTEQAEKESGLFVGGAVTKLRKAHDYAQVLSRSYDCVIANPPYMGSNNMNVWLSSWVKEHYPDYKSDLFSCFIVRNLKLTKPKGELGFMSPFVWMFIKSYEKLRALIIEQKTITSLIQLEYSGFAGATVPICTFTIQNDFIDHFLGSYVRLSDFVGPDIQGTKALEAIRNPDCGWFYRADQQDFKSIPSWPIAYWASEAELDAFGQITLKDIGYGCNGFTTGNNDAFLRLWYEVPLCEINDAGSARELGLGSINGWVPYNKGGSYRKWYGNREYIINWENDGQAIKEYGHLVPRSMSYQMMESISWSKVSSGSIAVRCFPAGTMFDVAGLSYFPTLKKYRYQIEAFINSSTAAKFLQFLAPTLNFEVGSVTSLPVRQAMFSNTTIASIGASCESLSKEDYDAFETSREFASHPLAQPREPLIDHQFDYWSAKCQERFETLKANEEELNRIFAHIYHMEREVPIEVPDDKVSVRLADRGRDVRSLLSYAVGCMLGRYSLDVPGLVLANQGDGMEEYLAKVPSPTFMPDEDGILPITDDEYFDDDVVAMFVRFLVAAYGRESLDANLRYVADSLGGSGSPKKVIRDYFVSQFYAGHCRTYQKRPIYWMLSSGPKGGFRALFYIHRYTPDLLARVRTNYVHEQQERYRSRIAELERQRSGAARDRIGATDRELRSLRAKLEETNGFEERLHHLADQMVEIDLDDGVKANYEKLRDVLAAIR